MTADRGALAKIVEMERAHWYGGEYRKVLYYRGKLSLSEVLSSGSEHYVQLEERCRDLIPTIEDPLFDHYRRIRSVLPLMERERRLRLDYPTLMREGSVEETREARSDFFNTLFSLRREIGEGYGMQYGDFAYRSHRVFDISFHEVHDGWSSYIASEITPLLREAVGELPWQPVPICDDRYQMIDLIIRCVGACEGGEELADFISMLQKTGRLDLLQEDGKKPGLSVFMEKGDTIPSLYMTLSGTSTFDLLAAVHEIGHVWFRHKAGEKFPHALADEMAAFMFESCLVKGAERVLPKEHVQALRLYQLCWMVHQICDLSKDIRFEKALLEGEIQSGAEKSRCWEELSQQFGVFGPDYWEERRQLVYFPLYCSLYGIARVLERHLLSQVTFGLFLEEAPHTKDSVIYTPSFLKEGNLLSEAKEALPKVVSALVQELTS